MLSVSWKDCDPTIKNVMNNITEIDKIMNLELMSIVVESYYRLSKKGYQDLETEMRKRDLNVGLIAVDWKKDNTYAKIVKLGKGVILDRKYIDQYKEKKLKKGMVKKEHIAPYVVFISCRPREYVIKETLTHSKSMEENFKKLKNSGTLIMFSEGEVLDKNDKIIGQSELFSKIQEGKKKIVLEEVDLKEAFEDHTKKCPSAELKMI